MQTSNLSVVKQDGRVEEFDREKLLNGISIALAKRILPSGSAEKIVEEIEEISSKLIGELTMNALRIIDRVAYIRFASVYRDFADEDDFREAVEGLQLENSLFSTEQLALLPPDHSTSRRRGRPRKS
jgi:transcriptional repressor NrdR